MTKKKKSRFGRRVEIPAGAIYALLAAISLICVTVVAVAFADDGEKTKDTGLFEDDIRLPHLYIDEVFFRSFEDIGITVEITIYITNDGTKDAYGVMADIWPVVDESNIASDREEMDFGDIGVNQTKDATVKIQLNAGTVHSVEILIHESNRIVLKGVSEVSTKGTGGSDYQNVEVRGTSGDKDYDGMPDEWEMFYGLNPNDPNDAGLDRDGDGINNVMEYRLGRNPNVQPANDDCADDDDSDESSIMPEIGEDNGSLALGAVIFLLLIVGVVVALIIAAVVSSNRSRKEAEKKEFFRDIPDEKPAEREPILQFEHMVKEGANDDEEGQEELPEEDRS
ncbi:MAG: hypothetical protein ACMUFK_00855, partial [Thermoplasmatota archaeon]